MVFIDIVYLMLVFESNALANNFAVKRMIRNAPISGAKKEKAQLITSNVSRQTEEKLTDS